MLDHTGFVVSDLAKARRFYDAIAAVLGLATKEISPQSFVLGKSQQEPIPYLWIGTLRPSYWAEGSRVGLNQMHIAFVASSKEMVEAFYNAALEAGGRDNGKPGPRTGAQNYYGAFVLDPDGNNIEAAYREKLGKFTPA
ncbi:MAG TPA: VOC family protein [Rhizomicrobium sp.]|nr:VOC family protein [Rhizomicrobium sp.]